MSTLIQNGQVLINSKAVKVNDVITFRCIDDKGIHKATVRQIDLDDYYQPLLVSVTDDNSCARFCDGNQALWVQARRVCELIDDERTETVEEIKRRVYSTAMQYAEIYGWCQVVQQALREMGIEAPAVTKRFVLEISISSTEDDHEERMSALADRIINNESDSAISIGLWTEEEN